MAKIQRQLNRSTRSPPSNGPAMAEVPVQPVQSPMAWPRAAPRYADMISARELGTSKAPPRPWTARAVISTPPVGASDWLAFGGEGVGPWAEGRYDEAGNRVFVTGKLWPRLFEISIPSLGIGGGAGG